MSTSRLRSSLLVFAIAVLAVSGAIAQDARPLAVGEPVTGTVEAGESHVFVLTLGAGQFVAGRGFQRGVDIVVEIAGPDGSPLGSFDSPNGSAGPEPFQFFSETAGTYRVVVRPFVEGGSGEYELVVLRSEPAATDPGGRIAQSLWRYGAETPGVVIGVTRGGEVVFEQAFGMANLTHDVPFTVETASNIGSVSKQFTAFAILLLEAEGRLSLDDDVRTHIPELPDLGQTVTIRHLLSHTSGYREILNALALAGRRLDQGDYVDPQETIDVVRRQPALQNPPGAEFNYNNTGYELLGIVVERVGGQPFPEWMADHVFGPLGMTRTAIRSRAGMIIPGSAQGYLPGAAGYEEGRDLGATGGAGGIYTTTADLAHWMANFRSGRVGAPGFLRQMSSPFRLTSGDSTGYGMGLDLSTYRGRRVLSHGGADAAHRATLLYFPELDAGVVVMSNDAAFNSDVTARLVADEFFGDEMTQPRRTEASADFDADAYDPRSFDPLVGRYELEDVSGFVLSFTRDGDRLITQATGQPPIDIRPTSDSTFAIDIVDASITFHRDATGAVTSLTLHQNGQHRARRLADSVEAAPAPPADLASYSGRYYSEEIDALYILAVDGDALTVTHRRFGPIRLTPQGGDDFRGPGFPMATVSFERDAGGSVTGLRAGNGRTRDVLFERLGD